MKKLIIRTISGLGIVVLTVIAIALGKRTLSFFIFLLSLIGLREFYDAVSNKNIKPVRIIGYLSCFGFLLNSLELSWASLFNIFIFAIIGLILSILLRKEVTFFDVSITFFGIFYIPFLFQHIIYLDNKIYVALVFIIAWGTDTFAYIAGSLAGKHKLCPKLSPKKTVEGSIGGIIGAASLTFLLSRYYNLESTWIFIIISLFGSVIAQCGDLAASKIKRMIGIKDFGFIMPGHGGVLDRFDSILFVAPYIYYILNYLL